MAKVEVVHDGPSAYWSILVVACVFNLAAVVRELLSEHLLVRSDVPLVDLLLKSADVLLLLGRFQFFLALCVGSRLGCLSEERLGSVWVGVAMLKLR